MSSPTNPSRPFFTAGIPLALGGACVALGFWLGRSSSISAPVPAALSLEPVSRGESSRDVVEEIRRLREEVDRIGAARSERAPAAPADHDLAQLQRSIDALVVALSRSRAEPTVSSSATVPGQELFDRLTSAFPAFPKQIDESDQAALDAASDALYKWMNSSSKALTEAHSLWTIDELVQRYGQPDKIETGPGTIFLQFPMGQTDLTNLEVRFECNSGRVVNCEMRMSDRAR